jgi:peptide-methionine (R)-S-oxide reductase
MNRLKKIVAIVILLLIILLVTKSSSQVRSPEKKVDNTKYSQAEFIPVITKSDEEWKKILTKQQYYVLREKGTDAPFSETILLHEKRAGTYVTADCNEPVFRSEQKFDSGTGWPSFWAPMSGSVAEVKDDTLGITRTEIVGKKCGGHLGHVFHDGPLPTGLRYCINPSALKFVPDKF